MAAHPALAVQGVLARGAFVVVVVVSLVVLFLPGSGVPSAPAGVDKLVHVALFAALAASGRWAGNGARVLAPLLVGYAAVSEVLQDVAVLDRSGSLADWVADAAGVLLGLLMWTCVADRGGAPR